LTAPHRNMGKGAWFNVTKDLYLTKKREDAAEGLKAKPTSAGKGYLADAPIFISTKRKRGVTDRTRKGGFNNYIQGGTTRRKKAIAPFLTGRNRALLLLRKGKKKDNKGGGRKEISCPRRNT